MELDQKIIMTNFMIDDEIEKVVFKAEEISDRVSCIGQAITRDYQNRNLVLVSVLRGSLLFLADLFRQINLPVVIDFMAISSYGNSSKESGVVQVLKDLNESILGKDVLVIEDIVDTGLTLSYLLRSLQAKQPLSLKVCALLDKSARRIIDIDLAYKGFDCPDVFVVGYGLDYQQKYRNLPYIGVLKSDVYYQKD
jgi:hypoxanthine phosphoribosyltransferase